MPQLLLEILSEEIPARMQGQAARDLARMARERLEAAGLAFERLQTFAGPRRLTLVVDGLPAAQADRTEERKGPRANAPEAALAGFLRSTGLAREALVEREGVLYARIARPGRPTPDSVSEMVDAIVRGFPWPKSMRWGSGSLRWVRPIRRILCVFDSAVVPLEIEGIVAGDLTEGHRFMGAGRAAFAAGDFDAYAAGLAERFVVLDADARKRRILEGARGVCAAQGLELVEDEGLLDEVAGLAEWPTPILGAMDPSFLDLPPEVIRTSMRTHQKYFAVRDPATGGLAPRFVVVANIEASDGGDAIAKGNARVLSARLNDARFFWDEDRKAPLEARLEKLKGVTFHARLGTMAERVERISALAREIAPKVGADPELAAQAARLAKADLATAMVGEFPELQGVMGGYYARAEGLPDPVADAVRDHYKPLGPTDSIPTAPVSMAVALADKLDTLLSFFYINEKPTGSKDPYALRRAALGVIRLLLDRQTHLALLPIFEAQQRRVANEMPKQLGVAATVSSFGRELLAFFADRLKVLLREEGKRHDLVDAVFAPNPKGEVDDDLVRIVARVEALSTFLATEDGANLLAGYRRAVNILKAEAKKNPGEAYDGPVDAALLAAPQEQALARALQSCLGELQPRLGTEDFAGAMAALAKLRQPVDAFFDHVLVNDADPAVRLNRLRLLSQIRDAAGRVADFSLITG